MAHYVRALMDRGHKMAIASPGRVPQFIEYVESLGIEHHALSIAGKVNPLAAGRIAKLAKGMGADIIHTALSTASLHGLKAARKLGVPGIGHVQAMNSPRWYQRATTVLCCSQGVADHMVREGLRVKDMRVIWTGVRVQEFGGQRPAAEMRAELGLPAGARVIGAAAGLQERKGLRYLVEAVALLGQKYPELHCLVAGAGKLREALEAKAKTLRVAERLHFLGFRADRLDLMNAMEVHVLPSIAIEGARAGDPRGGDAGRANGGDGHTWDRGRGGGAEGDRAACAAGGCEGAGRGDRPVAGR